MRFRARVFFASLAAAVATLLQACVYVPTTQHVYDPQCQVVSKHMSLTPVQIAYIQGCANESCLMLVAAAGVTAAASVVVSGSIAIVGNVIYWMEKQGQCQRQPGS